MAAENNYEEILEEVCEKLNNIDSVKELDVLNIKNSVESIESLITDTQAKLNFQEIKEKLESIAFQVDSCNEALLKDLYNDINTIKDSAGSVTKHLENLQNVQNLALTSAEFEEYQKQQLDLALKTNENIFNELSAIKQNSKSNYNLANINSLETQLGNLHKALTSYIEQIADKMESIPNLDDIGSVISDLNSVQQKNIKQTNVLLKELQVRFSKFQTEFDNKDFESQITKISEIYDSLGIINNWIEKVGFINQSIENVYARLGESIDFDDVAEKVDIIFENISALNNWTMKVDNIDSSMSDIHSKIASLNEALGSTKNIFDSINTIKNKLDISFPEEFSFEDIETKLDIVYENMTALNEWANKVDVVYDNISVINKWENRIDNVCTNLSSINELENKIDNVYDNLSSINNIENKIDNVYDNLSSINNIENKMDIVCDNLSSIDNIENKIDNVYDNLSSINDLENKIDIVYDNTYLLSNWEDKIDTISNKVSSINTVFEEDLISSKIDLIYENISLLNEWVNKIDGVARQSQELDSKYSLAHDNLNNKIDEITETLTNAGKIIQDVPDLKDKLEDLSGELHLITSTTKNDTESYIYTLLDIESDFLKLHKFLDDNTKITSQDINSLKERFSELNDDISSISIRTNKLILSADDANKEFKTYLESFKDTIKTLDVKSQEFNPELKYAIISEKICEMSKLMHNSLNAAKNLNSAFMYLAEWIDATGGVLNSIQDNLASLQNGLVSVNKNVNSSIQDSSASVLNSINSIQNDVNLVHNDIGSIQNDLILIKSDLAKIKEPEGNPADFLQEEKEEIKHEVLTLSKKFEKLENIFIDFKTDDISELRSLLTGIIVQLNTALSPDIDSLNERIDKLTEENNNKISQYETIFQEKINQNAKQISVLDKKIEVLNSKLDKLIEISEGNNKNYEIKDILNYIAAQIVETNNKFSEKQNEGNILKDISEKLTGFDSNINKIVSYIEED